MLASLGHVLRLGRAGFILAREGVFSGVDATGLPPEARVALLLAGLVARRGGGVARLATAIAKLGPSYVKLGQTLATRPDVVGVEVAHELESLQDRMAHYGLVPAMEFLMMASTAWMDYHGMFTLLPMACPAIRSQPSP